MRYVLVTYSVSSQTRAFRFRYVTIMKFSERVWGKESRTGTRQVYGTVHSVVYPEFQCRSELRVTNQHSLIPQDRIPTETRIFHSPQARDKDSSILASRFPREQIEKHSRPKQRRSRGLTGTLSVLVLRTVFKGLCHEDIAILGQFCPEVIT